MSTRQRELNHLRLFFVECGSPLDAIELRSESAAVGGMARLIGHSVLTFNAYSKRSFEESCAYVGSICSVEDDMPDTTLCLHISSHGAHDGLAFGADTVTWPELLQVIQPVLAREYQGKRILVISACDADQQGVSKLIAAAEGELSPPQYIFCAPGKVRWDDAAVGWTLLYHLIPSIDLDQKKEVKEALKKIASIGMRIVYFRWNGENKKYMRWTAEAENQ